MAHNSGQDQNADLPPINSYPNDEAIVSIRDARRRLAFADGLREDLRNLINEFLRLQHDALNAADMYDVEAKYDRQLMRSILAQISPPASWGDAWVGDLIYLGEIYESTLQFQALRRVAAYAEMSPTEVRQVIENVGAAMHAALGGSAQELLPRFQDVIEQFGSAYADYEHLRDSIAGRLDRMAAALDIVADNPSHMVDAENERSNTMARPVGPAAPLARQQDLEHAAPQQRGRGGRPRLEESSNPRSQALFNLYRVIINRRSEATSRAFFKSP